MKLGRLLISFAVLVSLFMGGYVGYLSALVDLDEVAFIQQVKAVTDEERLKKQLERTRSILDARTRAYIRKSQEFLGKERLKKGLEDLPELPEKPKADDVKKTLMRFDERKAKLSLEEQAYYKAIQEQGKDLEFFNKESEVISQMIDRSSKKKADEPLEAHESGRARRLVSSTVNRLLQLEDKRQTLQQEKKVALQTGDFWKAHPKESPQSIALSVESRDGLSHEMSPPHSAQIATALSIMPQSFEGRLKNIYIVYGDDKMRRGMSGVGVVFLKGEEADFFRVVVHEFGHIYDLYREVSDGEKSEFYDGNYRLSADDPSVSYYRISWKSSFDRTGDLPGFASSYGMTDPFEDFAEAFALYVLQGETFRQWKAAEAVMQKKYDVISNAFLGRKFVSSKTFSTRPFDITLLPVNYDELLGI